MPLKLTFLKNGNIFLIIFYSNVFEESLKFEQKNCDEFWKFTNSCMKIR